MCNSMARSMRSNAGGYGIRLTRTEQMGIKSTDEAPFNAIAVYDQQWSRI